GKDEYGLNQTLTAKDTYTDAKARVGILGNVAVNGSISATGAMVSGGVIGDDGLEYDPNAASGSDSSGTQTTVSSESGILAAVEDINGANNVSGAKGFFQDVGYLFANKYDNGQNLSAIDAIFSNAGQMLLFNAQFGGSSGLALMLGDL